ncbi:phosphatase PAP2 family protein [Pediococcus pentosaceus]|uniref:phosphatase PAP2 family protein n=1 Tax=Pediococcus pentosaceus TaxID=1255 RepID=UPI0018A16431|nr:phosphatase PAP2 family protein [Pediococcus pentosaceus]MBF7124315.1 phosphatase PAP2 family protein [Pediococcus pentosaceus]MCR1861664.1 phosphatase PAP2 family protein [Pediococcus pentosaceus]
MLKDTGNIPRGYVIVSAVVVVLLALGVKLQNTFMQFFDQLFSSIVQGTAFSFLEPIMRLITMIADTKLGLIYAIIIAVYLWFKEQQRVDAIWVICTMFGGAVVAFILKELVKRPRPTIDQIIPETGFSMPSGHTFEAFLVLAFIYLYFVRPIQSDSKRRWAFRGLILWQVLVMWSRIYMGAHYLTDTVTAVALGIVWLWVALWLYQMLYDWIASFVAPSGGRHQRQH